MKTHAFDGVSFFSGLVIAIIGVLYLIPADVGQMIDAITDLGGWFWPVVFLAIGIGVLIPALMPSRHKEDES